MALVRYFHLGSGLQGRNQGLNPSREHGALTVFSPAMYQASTSHIIQHFALKEMSPETDGSQPLPGHRCPFCPQCMENTVHHHSDGSNEKGSCASDCPLTSWLGFVSSQSGVGTYECGPRGDQLVSSRELSRGQEWDQKSQHGVCGTGRESIEAEGSQCP